MQITSNEAHVYSEFSSFFTEIWQECCPILWQKTRVGQFLFVASFESNEYLRKATACLIKTESLTAKKKNKTKQTRQLIKIPRHGFLDQGVKKT